MNKETLKALDEIRKVLGGDTLMISRCRTEDEERNIQNEPTCPECGELADRVDCSECSGNGTIECICEGMGGEFKCSMGCDV